MPLQPFESVALTVIGKRAGLRRRAGEHAVRGERQARRQRAAGERERRRADAAALREGLAERRARHAAVHRRIGDGDGLAGDGQRCRSVRCRCSRSSRWR